MTDAFMRYNLRNKQNDALNVILEPWAEEFLVPSASELSITIFFTQLGLIETEIDENYYTIWLWPGCRAEVSLDGQDQSPRSLDIPVPF